MDPSALIFVALAVAWAAYLIPKALEHHEESRRTRSIDRFSSGLRILARREPRSSRRSELVTVADPPPPPPPAPLTLTPAERRALRRSFARAARRRRRVLDLLFVAAVAVGAVVLLGVISWRWLGVPAGLALLWLVVSRRARRRERRLLSAPTTPYVDPYVDPPVGVLAPAPALVVVEPEAEIEPDHTADVPLFDIDVRPAGWDLQRVLVPTYVDKATAPRSVRTIDLDSTGVFSAGRNAADSALVRESETPDEPAPAVRRAAGS